MTYTDNELSRMMNGFESVSHPEFEITGPPRVIGCEKKAMHLENIVCFDADDKIIEKYPHISINRHPEKNGEMENYNNYLMSASEYLHKDKRFLPSMPLTCNILNAVYDTWNDKSETGYMKTMCRDFLVRYIDFIDYFAVNTVVDYETDRIVHYPNEGDIGRELPESEQVRKELSFDYGGFKGRDFATILDCAEGEKYFRNMTGLKDPSILIDITKEFGKQIKTDFITTPSNKVGPLGYGYVGLDATGDFKIMTAQPMVPMCRGVWKG